MDCSTPGRTTRNNPTMVLMLVNRGNNFSLGVPDSGRWKRVYFWMLWENLVYVDSISLWKLACEKNKYRCPMWKKGTVTRHDRDIASFQMSRRIWFKTISSNIHWKSAKGYPPIETNMNYIQKSISFKNFVKGQQFLKKITYWKRKHYLLVINVGF